MNYTDLQNAVVAYFRRGSITGRVPAWVALAESFLFRELDVNSIATSTTGTTTDSLIALPTDLKTIIRVSITQNGATYDLDYLPAPDEATEVSAYPMGYSLQGGSIRLHPNAGTGCAYTLYYTPKIEPLSGLNTTNWLLENAEDLYLYATCLHGAAEMKNSNEEVKLSNMITPMLASVRGLSERAGLPKSSGMQIRPRRGF